MTKLTRNSFMIIMISMVAFIIVSVSSYIISMSAMRHKVNNVLDNIQNTVSKNNYLDQTSYNMYKTTIDSIMDTDSSITNIELNWGSNAVETGKFHFPANITDEGKDLQKVSSYGDVKVIQIKVNVRAFVFRGEDKKDVSNVNDLGKRWFDREFYFTLVAPCNRYIK